MHNYAGKLLKEFRESNKFTQKSLAKAMGYSIPQFISLMENGRSRIPSNVAKFVVRECVLSKNYALAKKFYKAINADMISGFWGGDGFNNI